MSIINAVPNVAVGARFWTYYFKPDDTDTYFVPETSLDQSPPLTDLWIPGDTLYFAPTQVLISYETTTSGTRSLIVEVTGRDQFGYLADEVVTLTRTSIGTSKQGTARCYTRIESMTIGVNSTHSAVADNYKLGIGLSFGDQASPPPRADDTFRIPLLARVREPEQVLAVQDVFDARFHLPGGTLDLVRDLENLALETTMVTASPSYPNATAAKRFGIVFDSDSTSI